MLPALLWDLELMDGPDVGVRDGPDASPCLPEGPWGSAGLLCLGGRKGEDTERSKASNTESSPGMLPKAS